MSDEKPPLEKYYIVLDKGTKWHFLCRQCDEAWSTPKAISVGNHLALLNHARSHDE